MNLSRSKLDKSLNRGFYKMWEMIVDYNLIPDSKKPLTSVSLAEGPGSFMQAIMVYRKHMAKSTDKDLYCGITLNDGTVMDSLKMKGGSINCVDNESRMHIFETFPDPTPEQTNGDLTKTNTIRIMKKALQNKTHKYRGAQLVTADGGFTWRVNAAPVDIPVEILLPGTIQSIDIEVGWNDGLRERKFELSSVVEGLRTRTLQDEIIP